MRPPQPKSQRFRHLKSYIEGWDGTIERVADVAYDFQAPFNPLLGCDWNNKKFYYASRIVWDTQTICGLIHEMGHVFASNEPPHQCKHEYDFLGWEWLLAEAIGIPMSSWRKGNGDYVVNGDCEYLGTLNDTQLSKLITDRVDRAEELELTHNYVVMNVRK